MMVSGKTVLTRFKRNWKLKLWIEGVLYAVGASVFIFFVFQNFLLVVLTFISVFVCFTLWFKPYKLSFKKVVSYVDRHFDGVEYSSNLVLLQQEDLSDIAKLQQYKISKKLNEEFDILKTPGRLMRGVMIMTVLILTGFAIHYLYHIHVSDKTSLPDPFIEQIVFVPTDTTQLEATAPQIEKQQLTIKYPRYTNVPPFQTSKMDSKVLEGSELLWQIRFDTLVKDVILERLDESYAMRFIDSSYTISSIAESSGFYNFKFISNNGASFISKLYAIEVVKDQVPVIEISGIKQFSSFSFSENKSLSFKASITDDFGVAKARIVATVSKGSGESVKFREEQLNFDTGVVVGGKTQNLFKNLNLDHMKMEPGDELYFYIEVFDQKQPEPNIARSETFFAVIKDTLSDRFAVEGTMGVDLMPDYFRSQRQLIIDTEKLLETESKLLVQEFKSRSNELGFDQKVLRLKYAQFMGDETESNKSSPERSETLEEEHQHDDDHDHDHDYSLEAYTHKHDHDNEHNLVAEENDEAKKKDVLHEYLHNHGDPEEATLFTQSLKSKLRQALNQMWDAELYLRLYQPKKSLSYQYNALKLIQDIKNSARIYVHRIGFDPPPIKEDQRLTGKIKEVKSFRKTEELTKPDEYVFIKKAMLRLEELIAGNESITERDKNLFEQAANELAIHAIEMPGKYLKTLQLLKQITEIKKVPVTSLTIVQRGLFEALPKATYKASKRASVTSSINELVVKELEIYD
ncbi:tryptophan-rich sensory protein [Aquimarina sp. U1-2]|uniref:tryptophan-rich sensory protein n=1 Tax=Aquimarina sp. U1-2 TaxID=2823141 RepID=UPI001AECAC9C|nr:tryptophan-rich sensory protein [Aquimarina sp. U1-2]MBP2834003.1 tryptophan-rich sensory protein [Aquimarina sp. U1-2]